MGPGNKLKGLQFSDLYFNPCRLFTFFVKIIGIIGVLICA